MRNNSPPSMSIAAALSGRNSPIPCSNRSSPVLRRTPGFKQFKRYQCGEFRQRDDCRNISIKKLAKAQKAKSSPTQSLHTIRRNASPKYTMRASAFKRKRAVPVNFNEQQRLQRLKQQAFHQLDQQIRREQMALVQRIRYLDSLPAEERELLLQAEMDVETEDKSDDEEDDFQDLLQDICAIDIGEDDFIEVLQFEDNQDSHMNKWSLDSHEIAMGGPGDLF
ncbi:hypothetical protein PhCBS80983_g01662 [Powellomyces hirtus]|uniref:Uncharacterized protein n=1 Tax=Powellomyces hirtus TaxID=109895 RepID=A0A507EC24_9FUNG|nr:hypothetical protein PhCBS80983_g01662 [Powellomyces hirtus]